MILKFDMMIFIFCSKNERTNFCVKLAIWGKGGLLISIKKS